MQEFVTVAAVQSAALFGEREKNLISLAAHCTTAAEKGAKIIVLPELCVSGASGDLNWKKQDIEDDSKSMNAANVAETVPGPSCGYFGELAKKLKVYIVFGLIEKSHDKSSSKLFNSICMVSPSGGIVGHYRKQSWEQTNNWMTRGTKIDAVDTEFGRIGFSVGNDWKLNFDRYSYEGVWAVVNPMALYPLKPNDKGSEKLFTSTIPSRLSSDDQYNFYAICANWATLLPPVSEQTLEPPSDVGDSIRGFGYSAIFGRSGDVLAKSVARSEAIVYATIPTAQKLEIPSYDNYKSPRLEWTDINEEKSQCSDPKKRVKVASIQCSSKLGDISGNMKKIFLLCETAAENGAKFLVLPEAAVTGYLSQDLKINWHLPNYPIARKSFPFSKDPHDFALEVDGPEMREFCELSKKLGVYIAVPFVEKFYGTKFQRPDSPKEPVGDAYVRTWFYNTICLTSPGGKVVAHYRKNNPWPHPEKSWATEGKNVACYDTEYGRVGLAVCFDIHNMPKKYEPYKIWALLYPIAWVDSGPLVRWFHCWLPVEVQKYGHYVVGANWSVDHYQDWFGYGMSSIYSPNGDVIGAATRIYGDEIVYAELDCDENAKKTTDSVRLVPDEVV